MKPFHTFSPKSSVQSITWPALPSPSASMLLAMQYMFEQTQWLEPQEIRENQLIQLNEILHYARRHVPFYRKRFKSLLKAHTKLDWELWNNLPLLSRDDLQKKGGDTLLSTHIPSQHGKKTKVSTSGSTGKPVTVWQTELTNFFWRAFTLREHLWHRRNFSGKLAIIRFIKNDKAKAPNGLQLPGWGPSTNSIFETGPSCVLDIKTPIDQQAAWLIREQPHYMLTHPTNALALAGHFQKSGEQLPNLTEIRTLGETLPYETRKACKKAWGVSVKDMYSTREVGYIALQCPDHEHYHIQSENVLVEILDDQGNQCSPGQVGRVIVTSLNNFASPLIRYEVGDYAEAGESCPCGRGLPVINRVMGRVRNMLTLPTGECSWPVFNYSALSKIVPFKQLQVLQHALDKIELRIIAEKEVQREQEQQIRKTIQEALNYPFEVILSYPDEILRTKGGKYEEFISYV